MKTHPGALQAVILGAGILLCGAAWADNCSGTYHSVGHTADTQDFGKGVKLTSFSALSSVAWKTGELLTGACSGYALAMADGKVRVVYACVRKNKEGDSYVDEGSLEPGAERGKWNITTATGALAKTIGSSGWWQGAIDDGKVSAGMWGGNCK
jgi:hypothetical protein